LWDFEIFDPREIMVFMAEVEGDKLVRKGHLFEIDFIRATTVFSVVALHALSYTKYLLRDPGSLQALYVIGHALNYNRYVFMFVTAFVLTYVYAGKTLLIGQFYLKRVLVVFVPYVAWSFIYIWFNYSPALSEFFLISYESIITGEASFQLYYILLTLQFYVVFPFFLMFIRRFKKYSLIILGVSLSLQIAWMYYDFNFIQTRKVDIPEMLVKVVKYRDRIFLEYLFFFVFGGIAALHIEQFWNVLRRNGRNIVWLFVLSVVVYCVYFLVQLHIYEIPQRRASGGMQPVVVLYSISIILFLCWCAIVWAKERRFYRLIHTISVTSFGVFFVHVMMLSLTRTYVLPLIPEIVPVALRILAVLVVAFGGSVFISFLFLQTPWLSWMIGRPGRIGKVKTGK
jgi:peptidoglycan/LPS O-acetylase OafA/YrhL